MDAYDKLEIIGRNKIVQLFGDKHNLVCSENKYDIYDISGVTTGILTDEPKAFFMEVKERSFKSHQFDTAFIEYLKLSHLKQLAKDYKADLFYCCNYSDGVTIVFNLSKIAITDVYIKVESVKKKTVEDSVYQDKLFIELPLSLGKKYKLK
jgi:hypothetical protein